jgi:hypothetical protein
MTEYEIKLRKLEDDLLEWEGNKAQAKQYLSRCERRLSMIYDSMNDLEMINDK